VFGNCSTKLIGRLETPQDTERVTEWFGESESSSTWINQRLGARCGTFVGRWPEQKSEEVGKIWTSRPLFTRHSGAWSAEDVEAAVKGTKP
jgi:hypothetical protein